jgi:hypothetical protein
MSGRTRARLWGTEAFSEKFGRCHLTTAVPILSLVRAKLNTACVRISLDTVSVRRKPLSHFISPNVTWILGVIRARNVHEWSYGSTSTGRRRNHLWSEGLETRDRGGLFFDRSRPACYSPIPRNFESTILVVAEYLVLNLFHSYGSIGRAACYFANVIRRTSAL